MQIWQVRRKICKSLTRRSPDRDPSRNDSDLHAELPSGPRIAAAERNAGSLARELIETRLARAPESGVGEPQSRIGDQSGRRL